MPLPSEPAAARQPGRVTTGPAPAELPAPAPPPGCRGPAAWLVRGPPRS